MTKTLDENKTACFYDGRQMTVAQYKKQKGVASFESRLKALALKSAYVQSDKTDVRTGELYSVFKNGYPTAQNRRCLHFENVMLKTEPNLEKEYWRVFEGGTVAQEVSGTCERCSSDYIKKSNRQKFCEDCRDAKKKDRDRKHYFKKKDEDNKNDDESS